MIRIAFKKVKNIFTVVKAEKNQKEFLDYTKFRMRNLLRGLEMASC